MWNIDTWAQLSLGVKAGQLIFLIIIATTLHSEDATVYWDLANILIGFPQLLTFYFVGRFLKRESNSSRGSMMIGSFLEIIYSAFFIAEVGIASASTAFLTSAAGKIIGIICAVAFEVFWVMFYRQAFLHYYNHLSAEKKRIIDQQKAKSLWKKIGQQGAGRNA